MMRRLLLVLAMLVGLMLSACAAPTGGGSEWAQTAPVPIAAPAAEAPSLVMEAVEESGRGWVPGSQMHYYGSMDVAFDTLIDGEVRSDHVMLDQNVGQHRRVSTTANVEMRTDEFDHAVMAIRDLVWQLGGFVEHASLNTPDRFNSNYNATLRVPAEGYQRFLDGLRQIGEITFLTETSIDHTDAYFDASIRLDTRLIEQDRLLVLIERAQSAGEIAEILELERLLRSVRLEIEGLTRQIG
ncbi:MAG: DUF4349 domain-containing protein, partial [Defluviitaleaceae bacterium]|nr:DUF4349 domain-containing protein [Defluviitaleaceae bacterium]